jgi:hypothetical protein
LPSPPSGGTPGFFANPDPVNGVPATVPGYEWFNWIQEELAAISMMSGAALDGAQFTQARDAINALLAAKPSQAALQGQTYTAFTTTGVSGTYVLTPSPAIGAYAANQRFRVKFNAVGNGSDTINVSGKGPVALKQYDSTGAKVAPVISAGQLADIEYDGTNFVILDPLPANSLTQTAADARYAALLGNAANKFSVAAGVAATEAVNVGQFTTNQVKTTTSGNQQLPGGLILKWGYIASVANGAFSVTFPTAFPTAGVYANYILSGNNGTGNANNPLSAISASGFSGLNNNGTASYNIYWFAIGY